MLLVWTLSLPLACSTPCESMASGPERDRCLHRKALDGEGAAPAEVVRLAGLMEDPMVRNATVLAWVRDHRGAVSDADRKQLCGLLLGQERNTCERHLSAAHLTR